MDGGPWLTGLPRSQAPQLPAWTPHRPPAGDHTTDAPLAQSEVKLQQELEELLDRALEIVNRYLPTPFHQDFDLWIFEDVPYAAKTLKPQIILSTRILRAHQRPRLPYVLAHEMHHLWLMRAGHWRPQASSRDNTLMALLGEGVATWLCLQSGLFPELEKIFRSPAEMEVSFQRIREVLDRPRKGEQSDPYHPNKWGYYAGTWIIGSIDEKFGRTAWLELLEKPAGEAAQGLLDLYERTEPREEYRF